MDQEQLDTVFPTQEEERLKVSDGGKFAEILGRILPNEKDTDSRSYTVSSLKDIFLLELQVDKERQNMKHRDWTVKVLLAVVIAVLCSFCLAVFVRIIEPIFSPNRQNITDNLIGTLSNTLLFGGGGGFLGLLIMGLWSNATDGATTWRDKFDKKLNQE